MQLHRAILVTVIGLVLAVTAAACGADPTATSAPTPTRAPAATTTPVPKAAWEVEWEQTLAQARAEGTVEVWAAAGEAERKFHKDDFEAAFPGIKVNLFQTSRTSERAVRYVQEREAGVAKLDVHFTGGSEPNRRVAGTAAKIEQFFILPEVKDESKWADGNNKGFKWAGEEPGFFFESTATTSPEVMLNGSVDPKEIQTWWDLLDPKWKGKIVMGDPRQGGSGYARGLFLYYMDGLGPDFTKRFYSEMNLTFSQDGGQITDWVAQGRYLIGLNFDAIEALQLQSSGVSLHLLSGLETGAGKIAQMTSSPGIVFIPDTKLPNPNAARVYLNWYLSRDGQQKLMESGVSADSRRTDVDHTVLSENYRLLEGVRYESMTPLATGDLTAAMRADVDANLPK